MQGSHGAHSVSHQLIALRMEGVCHLKHAQFLRQYHYRYCPFCGMVLQIKHHCEHCGNDFLSEAAFKMHLFGLQLYKDNPCPWQGKEHHSVQYFKRRGKMYCPICKKEYLAVIREETHAQKETRTEESSSTIR